MIEYLLKLYADYSEKRETAKVENDSYLTAYYDAKADLAHTILQECFGVSIDETETAYIAALHEEVKKVFEK